MENNTTTTFRISHREWKPKSTVQSLFAYTSLASFQSDQWYFDSGFSKHMTFNKSLVKNYSKGIDGVVTFGEGNIGEIRGKCDLLIVDLPPVRNVLFVQGLKANLLTNSQLCDDHYTVSFSKEKCLVTSLDGKSTHVGARSVDNCCMLQASNVCSWVSVEKSTLWHHRLGHLNFQEMNKLLKLKAILS